jgi:hypothetical protein
VEALTGTGRFRSLPLGGSCGPGHGGSASAGLLCLAGQPVSSAQARVVSTRALSDRDWVNASQALDDLVRRLLVMRGLLEAEERLARRAPRADPR